MENSPRKSTINQDIINRTRKRFKRRRHPNDSEQEIVDQEADFIEGTGAPSFANMVKGVNKSKAGDWEDWANVDPTNVMSFGDADSDTETMGEGDDDCITFSKEEKEAMRKPWRNALIVKLLGKVLGFSALTSRINQLWKLEGDYKVTDLEHDYFIIRFQKKVDYEHVLEGGPWIIGGHYLTVRQWRPNFMPSSDKIEKLIIWIRFPNIPVEYFNMIALKKMGGKVGRVIKIDQVTDEGTRGKFARVCVELDLSKPLKPRLTVEGRDVLIEYEGLSLICFDCGIFGHRKSDCPLQKPSSSEKEGEPQPSMVPETQEEPKDQTYGPWMMVQRRKRNPGKPGAAQGVIHGGKSVIRDFRNGFDYHKGVTADNLNVKKSANFKGVMEKNKGDAPVIPSAAKPIYKGKKVAKDVAQMGAKPNFNLGQSVFNLQDKGFVFSAEASSSGPKVGPSKPKAHTKPIHLVNNAQQKGRCYVVKGTMAENSAGKEKLRFASGMDKEQYLQPTDLGSRDTRDTSSPSPTLSDPGIVARQSSEISSSIEVQCDGSNSDKPVMVNGIGVTDVSMQDDAEGMAGGIALVWNSNSCQLDIIGSTTQCIHVSCDMNKVSQVVSFVYVRPTCQWKDQFWAEMIEFSQSISSPWNVVGDFNDFAAFDERWSIQTGSGDSFNKITKFRERWETCNLIDAGTSGCRFTWIRRVGGRVVLQEKLDRLLWNAVALTCNSNAKVLVLPCLCSDHHPLFVDFLGTHHKSKNRPIRFEAAWLVHSEFDDMFSLAWEKGEGSLPKAIDEVVKAVTVWKSEVFGNIHKKKRLLLARIRGIQCCNEYGISDFLQKLEVQLRGEYQQILLQEELLWFQKSRLNWVQQGERNTKFFHLTTMVRRHRNLISALKIDENRVTSPDLLCRHVLDFFSSLFGRQPSLNLMAVYDSFCLKISSDEKQALLSPLRIEEKQWETVKETVFNFVAMAFANQRVDLNVLHAHMVLIPKGNCPTTVKDFRPITLLNTSYKILSKVIVNRLRPILQRIIRPFRNSFLAGRSTTDNILITQEIVHSLMGRKGSKGAVIAKIDLQKAYDNVSWSFLREVLVFYDFPAGLINLIMYCVSNIDLAIIWNGEVLPAFHPQQGLRQGDPLSPYLFILVMERLSHMILERVEHKVWHPVKASRSGPMVSHLFFADDLMLFAEASEDQVNVITDVLDEFAKASGLRVSLEKSKLWFSPNVHQQKATVLSRLCGIPLAQELGTYLGVPIIHGKVSKATYQHVVDKVLRRLANWKGKVLSYAGRRTLIQSTLSSIPIYTMQTALLPASTAERLDQLNRNFLWGGDVDNSRGHLVNWDRVCRPKGNGGLGLRKARISNVALLSKFLDVETWGRASSTWRGLLRTKDCVQRGSRWLIGDGKSISLWYDWWVGDGPLIKEVPPSTQVPSLSCKVASILQDDGSCKCDDLSSLLSGSKIAEIQATPTPIQAKKADQCIWGWDKHGQFTAASAYKGLANHFVADYWSGKCLWIWKLEVQERLRFFLWLAFFNCLNSKEVLFRKGVVDNKTCSLCEIGEETLDHILRYCPFVDGLWSCVYRRFGVHVTFDASLPDWLYQNATSNHKVRSKSCLGFIIYIYLMECLEARNRLLFDGHRPCVESILNYAVKLAVECAAANGSLAPTPSNAGRMIVWRTPPDGVLLLNTDGSSRLVDGHASAGGLIKDSNGLWVAGFLLNIGITGSLEAELWGIRQGDWIVDIRHICRESNRCANRLADLAHTSAQGVSFYEDPPLQIQHLLNEDREGIGVLRS
ncbi:reverse transcriptase [Corchorus capsularis]|uniref:Reverse transcriptase n=1 Tax=Corchorus capsularis TaxID=210143 RepID=A0A1R3IXK3_COCAP|nr:reverse transcriptase [Corchorus capsularis]